MAREVMDIGLTSNGDLLIADGDLVIQECTAQNQRELILLNKGDIKENPEACVGAINYLNGKNVNALPQAIAMQFAQDGMRVKSVILSATGEITTDAYYP